MARVADRDRRDRPLGPRPGRARGRPRGRGHRGDAQPLQREVRERRPRRDDPVWDGRYLEGVHREVLADGSGLRPQALVLTMAVKPAFSVVITGVRPTITQIGVEAAGAQVRATA